MTELTGPTGFDLIDKLVGEDYRDCYRIASELYTDEQARQACCATILIQYANIRKSNVKLKDALDALAEAKARYEGESAPVIDNDEFMKALDTAMADRTREIARQHFSPLFRACTKAEMFFNEICRREGYDTFEKLDEAMHDYMRRNGFEFEMECRLQFAEGMMKTTTNAIQNDGE